MGPIEPSPLGRVCIADGCWEWAGTHSRGYGMAWRDGRMQGAHRVVYEALVGPMPEGKQLDHLCRNRGCVNPAHVEPVGQHENMARGLCWERNRNKTHCPHGHPYDQPNTGYRQDGRRRCLVCHREREWRRRAS